MKNLIQNGFCFLFRDLFAIPLVNKTTHHFNCLRKTNFICLFAFFALLGSLEVGASTIGTASIDVDKHYMISPEITSNHASASANVATSSKVIKNASSNPTAVCVTTNCIGFNGNYTQGTDYDDRPSYTNGSFHIFHSGSSWYLGAGGLGGVNSNDIVFEISSMDPLPPTTGWLANGQGFCDGASFELSLSGCTCTTPIEVSINLPTASICVGAPLELSANILSTAASAGLVRDSNLDSSDGYTWTSSDGIFESSPGNPLSWTSDRSGEFIFTVTVTNSNSCSATATASVTVNDNPIVSIDPPTSSICVGATLDLTASGGDGYAWASSDGIFSSNEATVTFSNSSSAGGFSFTVTATNTNSCSATATASVTVNANPSVSISPPTSSICVGATIDLTASSFVSNPVSAGLARDSDPISSDSYIWTSSDGQFTSSPGNPLSWTSVKSGEVIFSVTATNTNSCSATATASVTVNANPSVSISLDPPTSSICVGVPIQLSASLAVEVPVEGGSAGLARDSDPISSDSYIWTSSDGIFESSPGNPLQWTSDRSGEFIFTVTVTNSNSCSATATASVTVNDNPTVSISPPTSSICVGATLDLTASGGDGYTWESSDGIFSSNEATVTFSNSSSAGGFSFTVTATNSNSCSAIATASVTVNAKPTASISLPTSNICVGASLFLTASGGSPYSWSGPNGFTASIVRPRLITSSTDYSGVYSVTVGSGICTATATTSVSLNAKPTASISPATSSICVGQTLVLEASGGSSYAWASSLSDGSFRSTLGTLNPLSWSSNDAGGFIFTVSATNTNSCFATATASVMVNANLSASISPSTTQTLCVGTALSLIASGGSPYSWSGPNGFTASTATASLNTSSTAYSGVYSVTVGSGICTATATTSVSVKAKPTVSISPPSSVCVGKSINLNASPPLMSAGLAPATSLPNDGYAWASSGGSFVSTTGSPVSWRSSSSGTFSVTVTATNTNSCSASATATIRVNDNPSVSISPPSSVCAGATLELNVGTLIVIGDGEMSAGLAPEPAPVSVNGYAWASSGGSFVSTTGSPVSWSSSNAGGFSFTVTATNINSCSATATASVTVGNASITVIPPSSICAGATINMTADGGISYSWVHSGGGNFVSSTNPVTFSSNSAGGYSFTVTATVSGGCTATATTSVSVKETPSVSIKSPLSVCVGKSINLNASSALRSAGLEPGSPPASSDGYIWASSGGSFVSSTGSPGSTGSPISWSSGSSGGFIFTVTATNTNSCSASATASVMVNANPSVIISPATSSICVGQTLNLAASSPNPLSAGLSPSITLVSSDGYAWASSGGTFNSSAATATFSSSNTGGFSFTVTATNSNSCSATATASVTVNAKPTASISPNSAQTLCVGSALNLIASGGSPYSWSGPNGFTASTATASLNTSSTAYSGVYSVTVGSSVCTATASLQVTIQQPTASINPTSVLICAGGTIALSGSSGSAYSWKGPNNFTSSQQNISISNATSSQLGIYSLTVRVGSCTASSTAEAKQGGPVQAGLSGGSNLICLGGTIQFTASNGFESYSWNRPGSTFSSTQQNPVIPSAKLTDSGAYFLNARSRGGCIGSVMVLVVVTNPGVNPAFTVSPTKIVSGSPVTLSATSATGSYSWSGPSGSLGSSRTVTINPFNSSKNGTYRLTITSGLCKGYTEQVLSVPSSTRLASEEEVEGMEMEVNTYPNPTSKLLTVEVKLAKPSSLNLQLFNATGNTLTEWNLSEESTLHRKEIDMSVYKDGLYLIQAQSKDSKQTKRVVKVE